MKDPILLDIWTTFRVLGPRRFAAMLNFCRQGRDVTFDFETRAEDRTYALEILRLPADWVYSESELRKAARRAVPTPRTFRAANVLICQEHAGTEEPVMIPWEEWKKG